MRVPTFALLCCCCCTHAFLKRARERREIEQDVTSVLNITTSDHLYPDEVKDYEHDHDDEDLDKNNDHDDHGDHHDAKKDENWKGGHVWGKAIVANTILVSMSLIGLTLLSCQDEKNRQRISDFFIGLSVSCMMGDAFFHIIPHMLGAHSHGFHGDHHSDHGDDEESMTLAKIGVLVGSMYALWVISSLLRMMGRSNGHCHDDDSIEQVLAKSEEEQKLVEKSDISERKVDWSVIGGVLVGDCGCNFTDGIAIGVAWSFSMGAGISTTVAIMVHEIPHELGDFVLYQKLGLTLRGALTMNFSAACLSYIGLFIGLALGQNPVVADWLVGMVAGLFIYISLVIVMPTMRLNKNDSDKYLRFFTQNIGLLLGFTILIVLALFEDKINGLYKA